MRKAGCPLCLLDRDGQGLGHLLCPLIAQNLKEEEDVLPFHGSQNYSLWNFPMDMWLLDLANLLQKWSLSTLQLNILISLVQKNNVKGEKNIPGQGLGPHCSRWRVFHTL